MIKVSTLKKNPGNPRQIKGEKLELLKASVGGFQKMMALRPMIVDENNVVLGGNMRLAAIKALGLKEIPDEWVKQVTDLTPDEKAEFVIKDNNSFGEYDWDAIANEWSEYPLADWGLDVPGFDLADEVEDEEETAAKVTLADRFLVPPFSVLDARQGYWQDRKRAWLALGIQSELGRGENLSNHGIEDMLRLNYTQNYDQIRDLVVECKAKGMADSEILKEAHKRKNGGGVTKMAMHNDPKVRQQNYRQADRQDPQ